MNKFRVFIVDDSTVYRSQIRAALEGIPNVEVVGFASNGRLACDALKVKQVDLVTLDLEMPEMDGLATLAEFRRLGLNLRVIVFSAATQHGAESTLTALRAGAYDFIAKPVLDPKAGTPADTIRAHLAPKLLPLMSAPAPSALRASIAPGTPAASAAPKNYPSVNWNMFSPSVVTIASSTGGPAALEQFFSYVRGPVSCPILIAQHMPPVFTATLAERLGRVSGLPAAEPKAGEELKNGHIYVAPGDWHFRVALDTAGRKVASLAQDSQRNSVRPAADHLFESAVSIYGNRTLGIVLTGMGADGRDGAVAVKQAGGAVLIQSRLSCVVFGMPGAVSEAGAFDQEDGLEQLAQRLAQLGVSKFPKAAA